jgi:hypothetical protein
MTEANTVLSDEAARIVSYCQRIELPFSQRQGYVEDTLATVRAEVWRDAITAAKKFDYGETPKCLKCKIASEIIAALESARTGKVGG